MTTRPAKRARSSTNPSDLQDLPIDLSKITKVVGSLPPSSVANLLSIAATVYPHLATLVQNEADRLAAAERAKVVDFDYLSKSAWRTLNVSYARMKDSHAYEMSGEASEDIEGCFSTIEKQCPENASFKTKANALETLRKIAKSICMSTGVIPREIRKDYHYGGSLVPLMLKIVDSLEEKETEKLRPWCDDKLVELQGIADGHCIFEDLGQVLDSFAVEDGIEDESSNCDEENSPEVDNNDDEESEGTEKAGNEPAVT